MADTVGMRALTTLLMLGLLVWPPVAASRAGNLEEACLLGQETAALFYELLKSDPDRAESILNEVDTRIARRAYYWAITYIEHDKDIHALASNYLKVCLRTGPVRMPAPQLAALNET